MRRALGLVAVAATLASHLSNAAPRTLDIYFIDVEGGQSTLIVTPARQALLIDAGFAADGGARAVAGDPLKARDANRIVAAARDAGVTTIDYFLNTHFHADHIGGVPELAQLMPIRAFIDHGDILPEAERIIPGTENVYRAYAAIRAHNKHIEPKPGDRLPLRGVEATIVSSAGATLTKPLPGAGQINLSCAANARPALEAAENPRSTGFVLRFGKFRFLDIGDLTGAPLFNLACPRDLIGAVNAYLIAHHGGGDAADPATFDAFKPRVAILNNGAIKGAQMETFALLHRLPQIDVWQLHRANVAGDSNFADARIANLDESTAHWLKLSAKADGSFRILNSRTGDPTSYPAR